METKPTEDQYNFWVSAYAREVMHLPIHHHPAEEAWFVTTEHVDKEVEVVPIETIKRLFIKVAEAGFKTRYWMEDIKDQYGHVLGKNMLFVFDN